MVINGKSRLKLVVASEFAVAFAMAANTGAGGDEPAEMIVCIGLWMSLKYRSCMKDIPCVIEAVRAVCCG